MAKESRKERGFMRRPNPSSGGMLFGGLLLFAAVGIGVAVAMSAKDDEDEAKDKDKDASKADEKGTKSEEGSKRKATVADLRFLGPQFEPKYAKTAKIYG